MQKATRTNAASSPTSAAGVPLAGNHEAVELLRRLMALRHGIEMEARSKLREIRADVVRREFLPSAANLMHYLALRGRDLRALQAALVPWGLSSLGRSESRVLPNLDAVIATLGALTRAPSGNGRRPTLAALRLGERRLVEHSTELFGPPRPGRAIRIMVTLPTEAADDYAMIRDWSRRGMDVARINCAHDDEDTWARMVANVRRAAAETGASCRVLMDLSGPRLRTTSVRRPDPPRRAIVGDVIVLTSEPGSERNATFELGCSIPAVLAALRQGHHVWIDEGKLGAIVEAVHPARATLRVVSAPPKGVALGSEKGLNFPDTALDFGALTDEDRGHLDFVVKHADIIGYSFVQDADDVAVLQEEVAARLGAKAALPPLIAKIETRRAVTSLPAIIVRAAGRQPLGVMIARGDLAVEIGYERLAEMQEELLWLCEAAHVPVVWATQVLDRLVKKGTPSRAEITDAAMAGRAECVMLNKGPYVARAIDVLSDVLRRMESHQHKKTPQLRALRAWRDYLTPIG